jgi:hypothetical protein
MQTREKRTVWIGYRIETPCFRDAFIYLHLCLDETVLMKEKDGRHSQRMNKTLRKKRESDVAVN